MASYSQKFIIVAALIFTIASSIPFSTVFGDADLCSKTDRPDVCQNIIKSDPLRFKSSYNVIDLAIVKSQQIGEQFNRWYEDSKDERMKEKYHSCAENYFGANRYLKDAQTDLEYNENRIITEQIKDSEQELEQCRQVFEGSPDPGHVGDRINEFKLYLDMVRAATTH